MLLRSSGVRRVLVGSVSSLALAFWAHTAAANPMDGVVEAGSAEISSPNPGTLVINQTSDKAIINWGSFDVGLGEHTQFVLPGSTSVTLNRDFSGDPSEILGSVTSNGRFYLVNPNGILFGRDARVDVAGLVATTHDIRSSDFLADRLDFSMAGEPGASVINQGQIRVDDLGFGAFVAPHVRNDGAIVAHMGKVELASASGFTLDLRGDSLISFLVENPNQYGILDANGQPVSALVENTGSITADGGQVVLRAAAARGVVDSVINTDGIIQANTVEQRGGKIVLGGGGAGSLKVKGKVTARGNKGGEKGGEIIVTGTLLTAEQTAFLDASGWAGGGKILFGGDYLGGKATNEDVARFHFRMEQEPVASATAAFLMDGAQLKADALIDGDGGKVVVWSEEATVSAADISAKGGIRSGNGGFIETSGGYLQVEKVADTTAANGTAGTWLIDPLDITIDRSSNSNSLWWRNPDEAFSLYTGGGFNADAFRPTGTGSVLSASLIEAALNAGNNVVVTTFGTIGTGTGDIRLRTDITKAAGGSARLSLLAADDVTIDPGVDVRSLAGELEFEVSAAEGSIVGSGVGQIALNGGRMLLVARDDIRFSSGFDMPDNLSVLLNNLGSSTSLKRVDVAFGQDRLRFDFSSRVVELYAGAISLLDTTATGNLFIGFAQGVNAHLYDRAIVSNADRIWELGPTVSASVPNANALNGIPEIEGFADPFWTFGAESGAGYTPVIEVSVLRDGTTDAGRHIVTATSGYAALSAYLTRPRPVSPINQFVQQATNPNIDLQAAGSAQPISQTGSNGAFDFEKSVSELSIGYVQKKALSFVGKNVAKYALDALFSTSLKGVSEAQKIIILSKFQSSFFEKLMSVDGWRSLGEDALIGFAKSILVSQLDGMMEDLGWDPRLRGPIKYVLNTGMDALIISYTNPTLMSACSQCVLTIAAAKNTGTEIVKVGFAAYQLNGDVNSLRQTLEESDRLSSELRSLSRSEAAQGNFERARKLLEIAEQNEQSAQEIRNNFKLFGIRLLPAKRVFSGFENAQSTPSYVQQ